MKFFHSTINATRERDAKLVRDLYQKSRRIRSDANKESFENSEAWFMEKHNTCWSDVVKPEERER